MSDAPAKPRYRQCLSCAQTFGPALERTRAIPCNHDSYCVPCTQRARLGVCSICGTPVQGWGAALASSK